jgi:hypothetical protein
LVQENEDYDRVLIFVNNKKNLDMHSVVKILKINLEEFTLTSHKITVAFCGFSSRKGICAYYYRHYRPRGLNTFLILCVVLSSGHSWGYMHRIGRTGRADKQNGSVSLRREEEAKGNES